MFKLEKHKKVDVELTFCELCEPSINTIYKHNVVGRFGSRELNDKAKQIAALGETDCSGVFNWNKFHFISTIYLFCHK